MRLNERMLNRRQSREAVLGLVYELEYNKESDTTELYENALELREIEGNDFIRELFFGVCGNLASIDELIEAKSEGWKAERISKVSRAVMRLCTYELKYTDIPFNIAINEALELVKKYDDEKAKGFVNGVLNSIAQELGRK